MTRFTAIFLTVLTGFSGLVYEVAWQKYLATLLGSHAEATAAVLAIFLGGLSAGYALFGEITRRLAERARQGGHPPRLLLVYGLVELGIGVYVMLFPTLFGVAQSISLLLPGGHEAAGFAFDVALTALLVGPPTVLMGGTIPILTLALAGNLGQATRVHAWIYGFNTAGAFAGALAGGFFLIPLLGLDGVLYATGCVNLFAGAVFVGLDRVGSPVAPDLAAPRSTAKNARLGSYAAIALLGGFATMTVQTTFNRIGALSFGASHFTFATIVAVFVLCIALGSLAVSALPRIRTGFIVGSQWAVVGLLAALYFHIQDAPYWAHTIRALFQPVDPAFYPFHLFAFGALLALLFLPIGLSGMLMPFLFHLLRREVGELGEVAGRIYSWNTMGSLLGALVGGYVLLFWLDLHHVYRIALGALIVSAALLTVAATRLHPALLALFVVPALLWLWNLPAWSPQRLNAGLFRTHAPTDASFLGPDVYFERFGLNIIFYRDDPTSTVAVFEGPPEGNRLNRGISTNGKPEGNLISDYPTMALLGLIPALMADTPERHFVIGYGTGVTVGELAALESTRSVDVAEISTGVMEASPLFDEGNLNASWNPKITVRRGDAYRSLLRSEGTYDTIISEPSNPWVTGIEMLYSFEFLEAAKSRLAPGGVFGQWFHLYELDQTTVELVLRTYAAVFPNVSVWFTNAHDVLLLGFDEERRAFDLEEMKRRFRRPDVTAGFARAGVESFPALLAHEVLPLRTLDTAQLKGSLHTLRHPILSHFAARAFFRSAGAALPRFAEHRGGVLGRKNSLLRRYASVGNGPLPQTILHDAARESCRQDRPIECAALFAHWKHHYSGSPLLQKTLAEWSGKYQGALGDRPLTELAALHGNGRLGAFVGRTRLAKANRASAKFWRYYHHAVPFNPHALRAVWRQCQGAGCDEAREAQEYLLNASGPTLN